MDLSWGVWLLSALLFIGAIRFCKPMPLLRDFGKTAGALGIIALAAATARSDLRWHLLWFTPVALVAAYFFALRRPLAMVRRFDKAVKKAERTGVVDPEEIRRAIRGEYDTRDGA